MDRTVLVRCDVEAGIRLADGLESLKVPVSACLWCSFARAKRWQLMIATPLVDEKGLRNAYMRIHKAVDKLTPPNDIDWLDIEAISPKDPIIKWMKARFGTGAKAVGRKVSDANIHGVSIAGACICRLQ